MSWEYDRCFSCGADIDRLKGNYAAYCGRVYCIPCLVHLVQGGGRKGEP